MQTQYIELKLDGKDAEQKIISLLGPLQALKTLAQTATRAGFVVLFQSDPPSIEFYRNGELFRTVDGDTAGNILLEAQATQNHYAKACTMQEILLYTLTRVAMKQNDTVSVVLAKATL